DDDGSVRITDFGIAIPTAETGPRGLAGAPPYRAPEHRVRGPPVSERTDIYSLGLVLYELLVGQPAFSRPGDVSLPPRPSSLVPDVNPQLDRVVMQALSHDPRHRPASALEMAASLPQVGDVAAKELPPIAQHDRKIPWWLAGAALAAIIGILAVASSVFVSPRRSEET